MSIKLYNTLTRGKEEFRPIEKNKVRMYVCGPTVYAMSHIGHARSAVAFDAIYRYLLYRGYDVTFTKNYTDIDDKIIKAANEEGVQSKELAERYIKTYARDMESLGVLHPTHTPKATETIAEIIELIQTLIDKKFAYAIGNGDSENSDVYFSVRKFEGYGKLSGKNIDDLESGARIAIDERKEDPLDFSLWKSAKPGEPSWKSPWGAGRPGWHIECSAMNIKLLGPSIDIHGGGKDLIFPHHENEIAQSEAATGVPFARYWMHNGFVNIEREKMSKSLGNILSIRDVLHSHTSESVRLFLLSSHYRSPIDYSPGSLKESEAKAERFYRTFERIEKDHAELAGKEVSPDTLQERIKPIIEAMDDDFNTAYVIGAVFKEIALANRLLDAAAKAGGSTQELERELPLIVTTIKKAGSFLGLFQKTSEQYFSERKAFSGVDPEVIEALIQERKEARTNKDFARSDEIREKLKDMGVLLEDTRDGTVWTVEG